MCAVGTTPGEGSATAMSGVSFGNLSHLQYAVAVAEAESERAGEAGEPILTVGRVNAVDPTMLIIIAPTGVSQRITMTSETVVARGGLGTHTDVRAGDRVMVNRPSNQEAVEIVVLPPGSPHGVLVVADTPDSLTIKNLAGKLVTMNKAGVRIDTTTVGTVREITDGSTVFVRAKVVGSGEWTAVEIIVLPDGTAFGT